LVSGEGVISDDGEESSRLIILPNGIVVIALSPLRTADGRSPRAREPGDQSRGTSRRRWPRLRPLPLGRRWRRRDVLDQGIDDLTYLDLPPSCRLPERSRRDLFYPDSHLHLAVRSAAHAIPAFFWSCRFTSVIMRDIVDGLTPKNLATSACVFCSEVIQSIACCCCSGDSL
jgi:hypothetical protein